MIWGIAFGLVVIAYMVAGFLRAKNEADRD